MEGLGELSMNPASAHDERAGRVVYANQGRSFLLVGDLPSKARAKADTQTALRRLTMTPKFTVVLSWILVAKRPATRAEQGHAASFA